MYCLPGNFHLTFYRKSRAQQREHRYSRYNFIMISSVYIVLIKFIYKQRVDSIVSDSKMPPGHLHHEVAGLNRRGTFFPDDRFTPPRLLLLYRMGCFVILSFNRFDLPGIAGRNQKNKIFESSAGISGNGI